MRIGIDASRAFAKERTGIEEYSYQTIRSLTKYLTEQEVTLYINPLINNLPDFDLPANWEVKPLKARLFWTQLRLSIEMLFRPPEVLFIPAHVVPLIHPKKTVVTVHGIEYEFFPYAYSLYERVYMRWSIKYSCRSAKTIIAVSCNTRNDLIKKYRIDKAKITVIAEGYERKTVHSKFGVILKNEIKNLIGGSYIIFVGRLEERKNITGLIKSFNIVKSKYIPNLKLVLVGKWGYGRESIKNEIRRSPYKKDIILTGYVSFEKKYCLIKESSAFLFTSLYEGFGLPILEAQAAGVPVIASNVSSIPEVAGNGALLVNPNNFSEIADAIVKVLTIDNLRKELIQNGLRNAKRFSWDECARKIAKVLVS